MRFVKGDVARALQTLRSASSPSPEDPVVPLSPQMVRLRFQAPARAAGVEARVTAHSARVGLASELTRRGASTTDVMLAGNWKTSRMVAHYSVGAAGRAVVAVVSVGSVGERLDDADVEGEGGERGRANRLAEGGRGRPRPHCVGVVLGHLVEDDDGQVLGGRGDATSDALGDEGAGCLHAGPEPAAVVGLDQEEASARPCAHAPSTLSHPFRPGPRQSGPSSPAPLDDNPAPRGLSPSPCRAPRGTPVVDGGAGCARSVSPQAPAHRPALKPHRPSEWRGGSYAPPRR